jgi:sugar O-acyltransferase (sialic acid O-acetyltransferase NeuD family)
VTERLVIIGAGGFGREVMVYAEDCASFNLKGFLDSRTHLLDGYSRSIGIIGDPMTYEPEEDDIFICAQGDPAARRTYALPILARGGKFASIRHPKSAMSAYSKLGRGCVLAPHVGISCDVVIGDFVCFNDYAIVGHDARVGDWCQINGHVTIAGGAEIGPLVTIHPNSVVLAGARIGEGVTVGAGSVVAGRIPAGVTVMGNPARRFDFK